MDTGIYMIFNTANAKFYIGSAVNIKNRLNVHRHYLKKGLHRNRYLQNAWNKYKETAFRYYKLVLCTKDELIKHEQYFIDELKPEYNLSPTAGNNLGVKHSEETRKRMSKARQKLAQDPEWKLKISESHKGKVLSKETRRKMSETRKELAKNPEWYQKVCEQNRKISKNPEFIRKQRENKKELSQSMEWRKKVSEGTKRAFEYVEVYKRKCEANKKNAQNPESRKKMSEAHKGKKPSQEHYYKQMEGIKRYWAEKKAAQQVVVSD